MPWCCASTRSRRFRPSSARRRCCRCNRGRQNDGPPTTTGGTAPRLCLRPLTSRPAPSSGRRIVGTGPSSFGSSSTASMPACLRTTSTSSSTTTARTRRRSYTPGSPSGRGFTSTFTPTYASWLNLVERWFAELTTKQLRRGVHRSVRALEAAIQEFIDAHNADGKPFVWTNTADEILANIARFAQRMLNLNQAPQHMSQPLGQDTRAP